MDDVVERARLLGKRRIAVIHSKGGKVSELHFARVGASSWDWLEPALTIKSAKATPAKERPECARLTGPGAPQWRELLGMADSGDSGDEVTLECGKKSVRFTLNGKAVAELVFE